MVDAVLLLDAGWICEIILASWGVRATCVRGVVFASRS
jgi:hypothetical protein